MSYSWIKFHFFFFPTTASRNVEREARGEVLSAGMEQNTHRSRNFEKISQPIFYSRMYYIVHLHLLDGILKRHFILHYSFRVVRTFATRRRQNGHCTFKTGLSKSSPQKPWSIRLFCPLRWETASTETFKTEFSAWEDRKRGWFTALVDWIWTPLVDGGGRTEKVKRKDTERRAFSLDFIL